MLPTPLLHQLHFSSLLAAAILSLTSPFTCCFLCLENAFSSSPPLFADNISLPFRSWLQYHLLQGAFSDLPLSGQGPLLSSLGLSPRTLSICQMGGTVLGWSEVMLWRGRESSVGPDLSWLISFQGWLEADAVPKHFCVGFARGGELPEQQRLPPDLLPLHVS